MLRLEFLYIRPQVDLKENADRCWVCKCQYSWAICYDRPRQRACREDDGGGESGEGEKETYHGRAQLSIWRAGVEVHALGLGRVDDPVDDDVGDMHAPGAELARQRLRQRALGELARREGAEARGPLERRRRARDQQRRRVRRVVHGLEE